MYGLLADGLMFAPVIVYLVLKNTNGYGKYSQTYISMLAATYGPLSITWFTMLFGDNKLSRAAVKGAVEMAGMGPFSLLWVGFLSFLMAATDAKTLKTSDGNINTIMAVIYGCGNVLLIIIHWLMGPGILEWIDNTPLPPVAVPYVEEEGEEEDEEEEE